MRFKEILLSVAFLLLLVNPVAAQSPTVIPFQGVIEHDGEIIPPGTALTFWIYGEEGGDTSLWGPETHVTTPVDGVVSLFLGASNVVAVPVVPDVFEDGGDRWLAVKVGEDPELLWLRLGSVAYAFNADRLEGFEADDFATTDHTHALGALSDVEPNAPSDGDRLVYRGGTWSNEEAPEWGYISINPYGCRVMNGAEFCGNLYEHGAIEMRDYSDTSEQARFDFGFVIPDDFDNGGDVVYVDIYWYSESTSGTVEINGNWGSLARPGEEGDGFSVQSMDEVTLGSTSSEIHKSSHYVTVPFLGLEPGDALCLGYYRSMWDTCDESIFISGIQVRYRKVQ